jgi:uncharacterized protein YbjT (DUF2867 family)
VRPVARSAGVPLDDPAALRRAFEGAAGAFLMIPFDMAAPDLHRREDEIGAHLAQAVRETGVRRVVLLSGLSAPLMKGSSLGAASMERRLDAMDLPELVHLRAGFFMENFLKGLSFAAQAAQGVFATAFRGDRPMPMVAVRDVGERAAELLTAQPLRQRGAVELRGPRDYTMAEATAILGLQLGLPVRYEACDYAVSRQAMLAAGVSRSFADAVMETARSFNEGDRWGTQPRSPADATATPLEQWAAEAFAPAAAS